MIEFVDRRPGADAAPQGLDAYGLLTERLAFEVESVLPEDAEVDLPPPGPSALFAVGRAVGLALDRRHRRSHRRGVGPDLVLAGI